MILAGAVIGHRRGHKQQVQSWIQSIIAGLNLGLSIFTPLSDNSTDTVVTEARKTPKGTPTSTTATEGTSAAGCIALYAYKV